MNYKEMVRAVNVYLKKKYKFRIINNLRLGKALTAERSELMTDVLPGITEEHLEILLEKIYDDGHIIKDDGRTVTFSTPFVFEK